jgi:diguanylate cyclase (GGDEF)-like protein
MTAVGEIDLAKLYDYVSAAYQELDQDCKRIDRAHSLMAEELEEVNQSLESVVSELSTQNLRFEMAIENMSQGLCMVNAAGEVVVVNRRFLDIYGIDPIDCQSGMYLSELLAASKLLNSSDPKGITMFSNRLHLDLDGMQRETRRELPNGQTISIIALPMLGGGHVLTVEDISERVDAEARIRHLALHDVLTGLPNRLLFQSSLIEAIESCQSSGGSLVLMYIDLDHFKEVNDTLGHDAGDELLKQVTARISGLIGDRDLFARLGGDEFAIVRGGTCSRRRIADFARIIIAEVSKPYQINGEEVVIGASIGIATGCEVDGVELQKRADLALYNSKKSGRSAYCFYKPQMNAALNRRKALEADLRRAVGANEFEVYYQPLVTSRSGQITGFEALLRWNHPTRGLVSPLEFIQLAEEIGEIEAIGDFVLRRACETIGRYPGMHIAVNFSPVQFRNRRLANIVKRHLDDLGFEPHNLAIEITEQTLLRSNSVVMHTLEQLKEMGISIVMDDFGTGYSSLSYLRQFPFDKIKIDRNFVRDIVSNESDQAIIDSVVYLARRLGMTIVAEGIENYEQALMLGAAGCDEMQGYHYSRPVPEVLLARLIEGQRLRAEGRLLLPAAETTLSPLFAAAK